MFIYETWKNDDCFLASYLYILSSLDISILSSLDISKWWQANCCSHRSPESRAVDTQASGNCPDYEVIKESDKIFFMTLDVCFTILNLLLWVNHHKIIQ